MKYFIALIAVFIFTLNCHAQTAEPVEKPQLTEETSNANNATEKPNDTPFKTENASATETSDDQKGNPDSPEDQNHDEDSFFRPTNVLTIFFGGLAFIVSLWSLWQNKKSNQSQNRAYVHASKAEIIRDPLGVRISLEATNTGHTPAKWWETGFRCGVYEPNENNKLEDHLDFESIGNFSRWPALANGFPLDAGVGDIKDQALILEAKQTRSICFFVYGIIRYETMFREIYESQFVFFNPDPSVGTKLSRPNVQIKSYTKVGRF